MAQLTGLRWDELDKEVRRSITWAMEAQSDHVSSRGLLIGMLLAAPDGPPHAVLTHFGVPPQTLVEALALRVPQRPIDPSLPMPTRVLEESPPLTANTSAILARAGRLRRDARAKQVDIACVFGAILETPRCTARLVLADLLTDVPITRLTSSYVDWLLLREGDSYYDALERDFPRASGSSTSSASASDDVGADASWPFLLVLREAVDERVVGLGFFIAPLLVATPGDLDVSVAVDASGVRHALRPMDRGWRVSLMESDQPSKAVSPPPVNTGTSEQRCTIAIADERDAHIELATGVSEQVGIDEFVVKLDASLPSGSIAIGSPVLSASGVLGMVRANPTDDMVPAFTLPTLPFMPADEPPSSAPPPATGTLSGAGNDAVGDVDQLKFGTYVNAFADLITSVHTQPPLTIGIFGSWGMGKSFLLTHIEREIARRQKKNPQANPRVHVVRFNAWEYSSMEVVWPALVRTIVSRLDKLSTWPWYRRLFTRVKWNLARQWRQLWPRLIAGAIVVAALITTAIMNGEENIARAIGGVVAALGVAGILKAARDPVANWVTALFADSDYGDQLRVMKDIKHDLTTLEERLHEDGDPAKPVTGRILILIDDLDRCEPDKAVEVLQALNLLLNFNSFVVVLGIDARIVTGAIEKHYEGLLGKAGASGYEYLDKIVQIPFRIPEPAREEIIAFVAGQLGNPEKPPVQAQQDTAVVAPDQPTSTSSESADGADEAGGSPHEDEASALPESKRAPIRDAQQQATELDQLLPETGGVPFTYAEQQAFELFADHLRPNPRHLKRLVNVYRLVRALARAQGEQLIVERPRATIRWLVMWSQWPYTSLAMVQRYEELIDEHGDRIADAIVVNEPMLHLLEEVRARLDVATRVRLDDDIDELRKLLSIPDSGLSWAEIRRIRPYTVNFNPAVEEQVRQPLPPPTSQPA